MGTVGGETKELFSEREARPDMVGIPIQSSPVFSEPEEGFGFGRLTLCPFLQGGSDDALMDGTRPQKLRSARVWSTFLASAIFPFQQPLYKPKPVFKRSLYRRFRESGGFMQRLLAQSPLAQAAVAHVARPLRDCVRGRCNSL